MKIILASNNAKKVNELQNCLPESNELVTAADFDIISPEETGTTFVENAIIKARHSSKISSLPAIADDSGLEVDYLKGAPGIYSSRFAGLEATDNDNNTELLKRLQGVEQRTARFRCVIVFMRHHQDPMPLITSGTWEGIILNTPDGEGGFGYDPIFKPLGLNHSVARLSSTEKRHMSHRGQALDQFGDLFQTFLNA